MGNAKICPVCRGAGYFEKSGSKRVVKPEKDDWASHDGYNIKYKICRKCKGQGIINEI